MSGTLRTRAWKAVPAIGLAVATALAFVGPIQSAGASTPKLYASPTGSGTVCGKTTPCSLAEALVKALPGTTIELATGFYNNQLTINKANLTIEGPKSGLPAVLRASNATANATRTNNTSPVTALVYVTPNTTGFMLSNVVIDGTNANLPSATDFSAVYFRSSSGTLDHVRTSHIFPAGGFDGDQNGVNVYVLSDPTKTAHVTMDSVTITDYNKNGVDCELVGTTCTISKSTFTGVGATTVTAQNGVQIGDGAGGSISTSTITGNNYTPSPQASGIILFDAGSGVVITKNTLSGNDSNLYVANDGSVAGQTSANVQVTKNTSHNSTAYDGMSFADVNGALVSGNKIDDRTGNLDGFGIGLYGATNSTVSKNAITDAYSDGIYVGGPGFVNATSTGNHVTANHVTGSGFGGTGDGIHADTSSANNVFSKNTTKNSSDFDVHDQGTGNSWSNTHCTTHASSSPLGLC